MWRPLTWILAIIVLPVAIGRGQTRSPLPSKQVQHIEQLVSDEMARRGIPALSLAIAVDNRLRYANGFGLADIENSVPARASTVYRTASIAKSLTAAGVMRLAEQGKLDLDAPIQTYCAEFPVKKWPLTCRQLLGHLGGIRHYKSAQEAAGTRHFNTLAESLALFKADPLMHQPGTRFRYTTYGYTLLGCAIESVSSKRYEQFMLEEVFRPAGMIQTRLDSVFAIVPRRARGYLKLNAATLSNAPLHDTSMKVPGGGLVSTSVDLVRFGAAMNTGRLLRRATVEQMWTRQKTTGGKLTPYGMGWQVDSFRGSKRVGHSGGQAGTSTHLLILPERRIIVAVMSNLQGLRLRDLSSNIAAHLAGMEVIAWESVISAETILAEITRLSESLERHTKSDEQFKANYRLARRDMTILALMFGIGGEHESAKRWKTVFGLYRDQFARSARNAKVNSPQARQDARSRTEQLRTLLGGKTVTDTVADRAPYVNDWSSVVDRPPVMQRLNRSADLLKRALAKKDTFVMALKEVRHEAEVMHGIAKVIAAKGMEDADDQDYRRSAAELAKAAGALRAAGSRSDYERSKAAMQRAAKACAACHEAFRSLP